MGWDVIDFSGDLLFYIVIQWCLARESKKKLYWIRCWQTPVVGGSAWCRRTGKTQGRTRIPQHSSWSNCSSKYKCCSFYNGLFLNDNICFEKCLRITLTPTLLTIVMQIIFLLDTKNPHFCIIFSGVSIPLNVATFSFMTDMDNIFY